MYTDYAITFRPINNAFPFLQPNKQLMNHDKLIMEHVSKKQVDQKNIVICIEYQEKPLI